MEFLRQNINILVIKLGSRTQMNIGTPEFCHDKNLKYFVKNFFEPNVTHSIQGIRMTNSLKHFVKTYFDAFLSRFSETDNPLSQLL